MFDLHSYNLSYPYSELTIHAVINIDNLLCNYIHKYVQLYETILEIVEMSSISSVNFNFKIILSI